MTPTEAHAIRSALAIVLQASDALLVEAVPDKAKDWVKMIRRNALVAMDLLEEIKEAGDE